MVKDDSIIEEDNGERWWADSKTCSRWNSSKLPSSKAPQQSINSTIVVKASTWAD